MRFGRFDDEAREYVITTPHTPYPWINYLGSQEFFSLISHQAGGYSFYRDARMRRLTRYRYNNVPTDTGGRYLYVNDGGDVWTPSYLPVKAELDHFETRHGLGYTRITGERRGVRVETLYFVPNGENAEIQRITVTNTSDAAKTLTLFTFVEFALWNALDDQTNYQRNLSVGEVEVEMDSPYGSAIYHKTEYRERRNHYAVHAVNVRAAGYDTDREAFTGEFNGLHEPQVPLSGVSGNSIAYGWYPMGSLSVPVELAPGESRVITVVLGYLENPDEEKWADDAHQNINKKPAHELLGKFATTEQVDAAFADLGASWTELLSRYTVTSTDPKLDRMVNIWNQYQCMVTFNMSRSASYFETGIGRGMGFRDSTQDVLGFVHLVPERARERILDVAATQFPDGSAYHQYQPLTKRGNLKVGSGFNDDPLWLIAAVAAYLKETGDYSILDEQVAFDNDDALADTLFEHLTRSFQHTVTHKGPHGLPLIGRADWNDCLNLNCFSSTPGESFQTTENQSGGVAESVFIAAQFVLYGTDYVAIAERHGRAGVAAAARTEIAAMKATVEDSGWDGKWFRRAYDFYGTPIGTDEDVEGKIFIEPQGVAVMAGIGVQSTDPTTPEFAASKAATALDSVGEMLAAEHLAHRVQRRRGLAGGELRRRRVRALHHGAGHHGNALGLHDALALGVLVRPDRGAVEVVRTAEPLAVPPAVLDRRLHRGDLLARGRRDVGQAVPLGDRGVVGAVEHELGPDEHRLGDAAALVLRGLEGLTRGGREAVEVQAVVPVGPADQRQAVRAPVRDRCLLYTSDAAD